MSSLPDRMKVYESSEIKRKLIPLLPIYIRLDGKCFSNFTKDMEKPYDNRMVKAMINTTKHLINETNACIAYTQSDEINLVIHSDSYDSQVFFEGKTFKITSVLAGIASTTFFLNYIKLFDINIENYPLDNLPTFDCRVINLPSKTETANMLLWRELDATRNAITSAARSLLTHREIQNKDSSEMQEMMFRRGINFNDYPAYFKRGTFITKRKVFREIEQSVWENIPNHNKPESRKVERSTIIQLEMPPFSKVQNREDVIFSNQLPKEES